MELQYIKAMEKHDIKFDALPEDAQIGIAQIKEIQRAVNMLEKSGRQPTEKAMKKLKAIDKWVYYEILDFLHDTDKNDDDMPFDKDDVIDDLDPDKAAAEKAAAEKTNDDGTQNPNLKGLKIDEELEVLISSKASWTIDELETSAPTTYNVLFDAYEPGDDNGIETSKFKLIESEDYNFNLTRK